jgi:hypothetical protein
MKIRLLAVLALARLCVPAVAADLHVAESKVGLYYSFEYQPSALIFSDVQKALAEILDQAGFRVEWHSTGAPPANFREIFVVHFRGECSPAVPGSISPLQSEAQALASTQISDGRVLPFAEVRCDLLRRYLVSSSKVLREEAFANAMARVTAHELFHMITRSTTHSARGASKAEYSRQDLLSNRLLFDAPDLGRLRSWAHAASAPDEGEGALVASETSATEDSGTATGR